jgi:hypothetical protein
VGGWRVGLCRRSSSCERRKWLVGRRNERTLDLADAEGRRVELAPGVLFDLAVFLRWPGVRPVLMEAERERQRRHEPNT